MSGVDVVARLQLRAEQFSSEVGQAFAGMTARAQSTAQEVRSSFGSSFAEVQKLARQSLDLPRTSGGSLNLGGEIAELERSAAASDRRAVALRELSVAQTAAAASAGVNTQAMKQDSDAAAVASLAEEKDAAAIRERIAALRAVQGELDKTASATRASRVAVEDSTRSDGNAYVAKEMLRHQLRAIGDSFASGAPLSMIFGQHIGAVAEMMSLYGQNAGHGAEKTKEAGEASEAAGGEVGGLTEHLGEATEAAKGMGGKMAAVGEFMAGPWGLAIIAAITVLSPFVMKLFEHNDAVGKAVEKLKDQAKQEAVSEQANAAYERSLDGLIEKTRKLNEEMGKRLQTQDQIDQQALADAQGDLASAGDHVNETDRARRAAQRRVDAAKQRLDAAPFGEHGTTGERQAAAAALTVEQGKLIAATRDYERAVNEVVNAQAHVRDSGIPIAEREVADSLSASTAAADRYTAALGRLIKQRQGNLISEAEFKRQLKVEQQARDAAIKAAQEAARPANREAGRSLTSAEARSIATSAGFQVNSADRTYAQQKALFDAWVAGGRNPNNPVAVPGHSAHEMGNALDIQKTAGATVASIRAAFAAEGVRLTKVFSEQGHWHVEWARDAAATADANAATREASAEQRQLKQDTEALTSAFDPAAAAALEYSKSLAEIARLSGAGQLTEQQRLDYMISATQKLSAARLAAYGGYAPLGHISDIDPASTVRIASGLVPDGRSGGSYIATGNDLMPGLRDLENDHAARAIKDAERDEDQRRQEEMIRSSADLFADLFTGSSQNVWSNFQRYGQQAIADLAQHALTDLFTHHVSDGLKKLLKGSLEEGAGYGSLGGSVFSAITGGKNNTAASAVGGVLGDVAGKALGPAISKAIGGTLGKTLGGAAGPIGSVVGGILGDALGGLFNKAQNSGAGISTAGGVFAAGTAIGTSSALQGQASSLAGSVSSGLQKIADQLGASITGSSDVRIGTSNGNIHINTHGGQIGQKGSGDINFGSDQEGAVRAAIADALSDGVLSGISDAAQRILKSGQDIDRALSKALAIESIPKDLKAMLDPVGAALDTLNTKWKATVAALDEGGASAEQYAQAEKLYKLQLDQVKASTASASQGLKDFLLTLNAGGSSPLSLRDQEASAKAALQPFLDTIAAGGNVDQSKYQSAAQSFLDIERQLYGSTQAFFDQFDAIQAATNRAIDAIDNAVPVSTPVADPFVKATADSTAATADGVATSNEIASQQTDLLASIASSLAQLAANGGSLSGSFVGAGRGFSLTQAA